MRIAGFVRLLPIHRGVGGMQGHAQNLYRGLAEAGHDVHVFTSSHPKKKEEEIEHKVKIHYLKGTPSAVYSSEYFTKSKEKFDRLHKNTPFDVIHSESSAARRLCNGSVPVCATWHGMAYCGLRSKMNEIFTQNKIPSNEFLNRGFEGVAKEARDFAKYDHHVAISHQAYDDLLNVYQIPKEQASLVFNGFDSIQFKPDKNKGALLRKQVGIPGNAHVFGCGGRLTVDKGHRVLIRAIPELLRKYPKAYVLVVGTGPIEVEYKRLKHPHVVFIGAKPYEEMPAVFNAMNVYINPTLRYLGLDMTMQEAMLCGVPVVASDTGSIKRSLVPNDTYGFTHEVGDVKSLLSSVLNSVKKRYEPNAISSFVRQFSTIDVMVKGMEQVFKLAIARRK